MQILVTGGAGYIGSHTCVELLMAGHQISVVDNLSNSSPEALERVEEISGKDLDFFEVDLLNMPSLEEVFQSTKFDAVIHFAGLKAVGESVEVPLKYYHNNLTGTFNLCAAMEEYGVKNFVFSSSATVYGEPHTVPITEGFPTQPTNPYGHTKLMIEQVLTDFQAADKTRNVAILRYFNPVGAHASGLIGEDPSGIPNNIMPFISQVAVRKLDKLEVFGNDYPTRDGTGVRDYIHVVDLAKGHLAALNRLQENPGVVIYNLGTGQGYSVMELVSSFEAASGVEVPYEVVGRRSGDIPESYADPGLANKELDWKAEKTLEEMCMDTWRWQSKNPDGYHSK